MNKDQTKAALDALDEPPHPSCPCVVGVLLEKRIRELEARTCPHIVSSAEGTLHCALAEEATVRWAKLVSELREELNEQDALIKKLEEERDALREESLGRNQDCHQLADENKRLREDIARTHYRQFLLAISSTQSRI